MSTVTFRQLEVPQTVTFQQEEALLAKNYFQQLKLPLPTITFPQLPLPTVTVPSLHILQQQSEVQGPLTSLPSCPLTPHPLPSSINITQTQPGEIPGLNE